MSKSRTKQANKIVVLVIGMLLTVLLAFVFLSNPKIKAYAHSNEWENGNQSLLSENFEDDNVIVVLDSKISKINKIHNKKFFDNIEIDYIEDLTEREINKKSKNNDFRQILQIYLADSTKETVLQAITCLERIEGVISAEPNYVFELEMEANDPKFADNTLWGLNGTNGINTPDAWALTQGSQNVRVGVIDTGIARHSDLNANLVSGRDFYNNNSTTTDDTNSHGTHVAGTIGAIGNNGVGVVGVNWNVTLVPMQACDESHLFSSSTVVNAIEWAEDRWGTNEQIDVINYSVGGFGRVTAVREAVRDYHGLFVWAAGNETENVNDRTNIYGSFDLPNLISVGAIESSGQRRSSSNYGNAVNIYAPGGSIYSTVPSGYDYMSGTSMAAPHVTGVAALMLSANPSLTGSELKTMILSNTDTISITIPNSTGGTISQSVKKLNAAKAVNAAADEMYASRNVALLYVEGSVSDYKELAASKGIKIYSGISYTVTAPEIDGYKFIRWDFRGGYPKVTPAIYTYSESKTIQIINKSEYGNYKHINFYAIYEDDSCIAEGTLITLADGNQVPVETLTGEEELLVWNLQTGNFDTAPILFIDSDPRKEYEIILLEFSDGTQVKVIFEHAFWDFNLNKYVFLRAENATEYIGDWFNKQTIDEHGQLSWEEVQLVNITIRTEYTKAYSPVTYGHLCYYVNGMLSMPGATEGLINIFEVEADTLKYDEAAYEADTIQYGLFTYEEFSMFLSVSEEVFNAFNGQYLKVAIGKGLINYDTLEQLISRYSKFFE